MSKPGMPIFSLSDVKPYIRNISDFNESFMAGDINSRSITRQPFPGRLNAACLLLTLKGSLRIGIDGNIYETRPESMILFSYGYAVQIFHSSKDFEGKIICLSEEMFRRLNLDFSYFNYLQIKKKPYIKLNSAEMDILLGYYELLWQKARSEQVIAKREVLLHIYTAMLYEMGDVFDKNFNLSFSKLSRKEQLMEKFLGLLGQHYKEHHQVTFYAEKLFITPQYLSSLLNDLSGRNTSQWIDSFIIAEAETLLKQPGTTIQEIAEMLNFPDQSAFGKYFKKHTGKSPTLFRKSR